MTYDNNNTGVLFRNEKKQPGDKLPDYRGNCEVNGVKLDVAGWLKESTKKPGVKFMSLKFSVPFKKPEPEQKPSPKLDLPEDDIPF